jgi:hypothetical protein
MEEIEVREPMPRSSFNFSAFQTFGSLGVSNGGGVGSGGGLAAGGFGEGATEPTETQAAEADESYIDEIIVTAKRPRADGPSYMDRYVDWTSDHVINVGPYVAALAGGLWPKSLSLATGGRPPLLGSTNPLTSVPRAFGFPGADTAIARTGAAGIGLITVGIGFYNVTILLEGFLYAIPD